MLAVLVLFISAVAVANADGPDPNYDTAQRDDIVLTDDGGGASGAVGSGTDGHDPTYDTAERDEVVPEDGGGASGAVDSGTDGRDPNLDTARRDDVVPGDGGGGASGAVDSGADGHDPTYDTAERDEVVPEDGGGASGAVDSGTDGRDPNLDTAKRDDAVPADDGGASGTASSGTDGSDPNYDTAKRDDAVPADDEGGATGSSATAPAPTGLRVTSDTDDSVSLSWTAVTNAAKYKVEYKASSSTRWLHATYTSGTTATVDDLDCNAGYNFRVRARGDGIPYSYSYGSASSSVSETTDKCRAPAPTGFRVTSDTDDSVSLSWTAVTDAAKYKVEYKTSSATTWRHATYASGTTATVDDLSCNSGYNFRVRARGDGSPYSYTYGDPSSSVSETTDKCNAPAPTGLKVTSDTEESVSLSWKSVTDGAYYKVEYKASSSSTWLHATYSSGTSATVDDLDCDKGYNFRVRTRGDGSPYSYLYGDPSTSVSETTDKCIPPPPAGLTVDSDTEESVSLSWTSLTGAALYKVEYKASSSSSWLHATYTSSTSATVDDLNCNAAYNFRVRARGNGTTYSTTYGDASSSVSETTDKCKAPAPTGLRVTSDTETSVSLSWTAVTDAALYKVEYKASSSSTWLHATYTSRTTATVGDLRASTGYNFRVRARGDGSPYSYIYGDPSSSVSETTDKPIIGRPKGLEVTSDTDDSVSLSWSSLTDAALYKVEYKASTSSTWLHATYTSVTTATVDSLRPGKGYDFRVRARGDGTPFSTTYGAPSSTVSETTDALETPAPTGLRVMASTQTGATLNWTALTDAQYYKLERSTSSTGPWTSISDTISATSYTVTGLDCNTTYYFKVSARGDGSPYSTTFGSQSSGDVSKSTTGCPNAPAPLGLESTDSAQTSVSLSWDAVADAQYYKLERSLNGSSGWTLADAGADSITGTSDMVTGLDCNTTYYFRVSARGDGQPYSTAFGSPSTGSVSKTTSACAPSFGRDAYTFTVAEGASVGSTLGTASASNGNGGGTVSYSIVEGNSAGRFSIGSTNGQITVAAALNYELSSAYELTVKASNSQDSTIFDLATANITVTNVNEALAFDLDSYDFAIPLNSRTATSNVLVGGVRAADPDAEDKVTYSITAGNLATTGQTEGPFTVDGLGRIWAVPSRLPQAATDYTLTLQAADGNSHTDTTTLTVRVTSLPIATLEVDYDRLVTGEDIDAVVKFENGTRTSASQLSLTITRPSSSSTSGASGASSTTRKPATSFVIGGITFTQLDITNGRGFDFSMPGATAEVTFPIPSTRVPTTLRTGNSYLNLSRRATSTTQFVVSQSKVPLVIYDDDIAIGGSYSGDWGFIPSNSRTSEPNERRFSLTVPSDVGSRNVRIDLTSGDRDPVLMLEDSSGNLLEWNDDGGVGLNAKIVRQLSSGDYEVVASTQWSGGKGSYELTVSYSEEAPTDPDGEFGDLSGSSFYISRAQVDTANLVPTGRSITSTSWKSVGSNGSCGSALTSTTQGTIVCLVVNGSGFEEDDRLMAFLLVESADQPTAYVAGAVTLTYQAADKMQGKWVAQHLSRYAASGGATSYRVAIAGHESILNGISVSQRSASGSAGGASGAQDTDHAAGLRTLLTRLGFPSTKITDIYQALWLLLGEHYENEQAFARDFLEGALYGEWGVRNDDHGYGVAYFAGWIAIGFIPGVDILPDLRDVFALEITRCSGFGWDSWKCRARAAADDLVDVVAVVPAWGKIADTAQIGRIVSRFDGSSDLKGLLKQFPTVVKRLFTNKGCWSLPRLGKQGRGACVEERFFDAVWGGTRSGAIRLDAKKTNTPVIDLFRRVGDDYRVSSVKSLDLDAKTYTDTASKITSRIDGYLATLRNRSESKIMGDLRERIDDLPTEGYMLQKQLDIVLNKTPTDAQQIRALKQSVCRVRTASQAGVPALKMYVNTGSTFTEWSGSRNLTPHDCSRMFGDLPRW